MLQPGNEVAAAWRGRLSRASRHHRLRAGAGSCGPHSRRSRPACRSDVGGGAGWRRRCRSASRMRMSLHRSHGSSKRLIRRPTGRRNMCDGSRICSPLWASVSISDAARCRETRRPCLCVAPHGARGIADGGLPYHDKLLLLPDFLWQRRAGRRAPRSSLGMALTGHFLAHHVFAPQGRALPAARMRLAERMGAKRLLPLATIARLRHPAPAFSSR